MSKKILHIIYHFLLLLILVFCMVALVDYDAQDPGWSYTAFSGHNINNITGIVGAWVADVLLSLFGYVSFLIVLFLCLNSCLVLLVYNKSHITLLQIIYWLWVFFTACGLASMHFDNGVLNLSLSAGGILGYTVAIVTTAVLNLLGATLLLFSLFVLAISLALNLNWLKIVDKIGDTYLILWTKFFSNRRLDARCKNNIEAKHSPDLGDIDSLNYYVNEPNAIRVGVNNLEPSEVEIEKSSSDKVDFEKFNVLNSQPNNASVASVNNSTAHNAVGDLSQDDSILSTSSDSNNLTASCDDYAAPNKLDMLDETNHLDDKAAINAAINNIDSYLKTDAPAAETEKTIPDIAILGKTDKYHPKYINDDAEQLAFTLESKLKDFGVVAKVVAYNTGPVVTRFEVQLETGTKVVRVSSIAKDLARTLALPSIRVVEVIAGKSVIGIEVPNVKRHTVAFKQLIHSPEYNNPHLSPLSLVVGVDIEGEPVIMDLAKMPHLLVAGTTGSGKSVGINAMLSGILFKATPEQVRFIMVDPKMLELSVYNNIPHLLTPVITDMQDTYQALNWCVGEMERRYKVMAQAGVRNIESFNYKVKHEKVVIAYEESVTALPYIVIVIDEFADMILMLGKKVETLIIRLTQKARAAGIHVILATQRPSVNIITGLIKANIPCRMSFQVSSKIDARTILDQSGAEQLLGAGDMLYLQPGQQMPMRIHGSFISDEEVHKLVASWHGIAAPNYVDDILEPQYTSDTNDINAEDRDFLYDKAVSFVIEQKKVSTSSVQRKFQIGYNRAARIIDSMEAAGIVSSMDSSGKRVLLVNED